jgi:CRP/FNR family cyclic AMP-dependent transcriptional regulator
MPIQLPSTQNPVKPRNVSQSDPLACLAKSGVGRRIAEYTKSEIIFSQAALADSVFYVLEGTVILRVVSSWGKEAIVGILGPGDFFGEGCLSGQPLRTSTAEAMTECSLVRLEKLSAIRLIRDEPAVSELLLQNLLSRKMKMEEDLVDQLFNTSERRLARLLIQLGKIDGENKSEAVIPKINQETLAEIVGTTRSRVSFFMNKFRRLGLIDYLDHTDVLTVRRKLLSVVLHDQAVTPLHSFVGARVAAGAEERSSFGQLSM